MPTRRAFAALALAALLPRGTTSAADGGGPDRPRLGPGTPVSYADLVREARAAAATPYRPVAGPDPAILDAIDYDAHGAMRQPPAKALYAGEGAAATFFPLGRFFRRPVRLYAWEGGVAREIAYDPGLFDAPPDGPAARLGADAGFAGFRYHVPASADPTRPDWLAFLGASYFRSSGDGGQYGISARGVAVDTAPMPGGAEDFPDFTRFYLGPERDGAVTVLAYLDGASVAGAFRFVARREPRIVVDVESALFPRRPIDRLGIAPLTSMFWYSETDKRVAGDDWRPEVHDSDGLLLATGAGERIWRPLNNPPGVAVSAFLDAGPRGFGLMQRDRAFDHYRDDVAFERRPNLWIEPVGDWGAGSVQLVEIPTVREYDDNVVAMWVPARKAVPGEAFTHAYRMHWCLDEPGGDPRLARCVATRTAAATDAPAEGPGAGEPSAWRQYVLDFDGPALEGIDPRAVEVDLALSRGISVDVGAWHSGNGARRPLRVFLKVHADGTEAVDMRLVLRSGGEILSEAWVGQHHPGTRRA